MYTQGVTNFLMPGKPAAPFNTIYAKPARIQADGVMRDYLNG